MVATEETTGRLHDWKLEMTGPIATGSAHVRMNIELGAQKGMMLGEIWAEIPAVAQDKLLRLSKTNLAASDVATAWAEYLNKHDLPTVLWSIFHNAEDADEEEEEDDDSAQVSRLNCWCADQKQ